MPNMYVVSTFGGTGAKVARDYIHLQDSRALGTGLPQFKTDIIIPQFDEKNVDSRIAKRISDINGEIQESIKTGNCRVEVHNLAKELVRSGAKQYFQLDPAFTNLLLYQRNDEVVRMFNGMYRDDSNSAVICCTLKEELKKIYEDVVKEIIKCNNQDQVRVAFVCSLFGAEGRGFIAKIPEWVGRWAIEKMTTDEMDKETATKHVQNHYRPALILVGTSVQFPRDAKLRDDTIGRSLGFFEFLPHTMNDFHPVVYYCDHDRETIAADKVALAGPQFRRNTATDMVAADSIYRFFTDEDFDVGKFEMGEDVKIVIPNYSKPATMANGNEYTTRASMDLSEGTFECLDHRLRFDAVMRHELEPELGVWNKETSVEQLMNAAFTQRTYIKGSFFKKLTVNVDTVKKEIETPFKLLDERESYFIQDMYELAFTHKDWAKNDPSGCDYTFLYNRKILEELVNGEEQRRTTYSLDQITQFTDENNAKVSKFNNGMTLQEAMDKATKRYRANATGKTSFFDFASELIQVCGEH